MSDQLDGHRLVFVGGLHRSGRGRSDPDMTWEPKAAFAAVADHYRYR